MITLGELKIYPKLYAAAVENARDWYAQKGQRGRPPSDNSDLLGCFGWSSSPQGFKFWNLLSYGCLDTAKSLHPKLFEEEAKAQYDSIQIGCKKIEGAAVNAVRKAHLDLDTDLLPERMEYPLGEVYVDGRKYRFELVVRMEVEGE